MKNSKISINHVSAKCCKLKLGLLGVGNSCTNLIRKNSQDTFKANYTNRICRKSELNTIERGLLVTSESILNMSQYRDSVLEKVIMALKC